MSNIIHVTFNPRTQTAADEITFDFTDFFASSPLSKEEYKQILINAGCTEFEVAYELKKHKDLFE